MSIKARIKFSKIGSMRFIGHLDVMRYFQKAFRRAEISLSYSQGYSPHQLMSFTSPLGIGLTSDGEYLDITLDKCEDSKTMVEKINSAMNDEITVKEFILLEEDAKPSMATLAACDYMIGVKPGKESPWLDKEKRQEIMTSFLSMDSIEIKKKTKRSETVVDIRDNIYAMTDSLEEFRKETLNSTQIHPDMEIYTPVFYMELTAGSIVNIKPELVLEALSNYAGTAFEPMTYQIHRLEMYGDANGKKGEIHTFKTETKCKLVPMAKYQALES